MGLEKLGCELFIKGRVDCFPERVASSDRVGDVIGIQRSVDV